MKYLRVYILGLILLFALGLRIYNLDKVPPSLFGDEVDVGYQAYSILHTGRDLQGNFLPFYIRSLSEYRTPLFLYSDVPFVAIFGLNEWGVRLSAVFWGMVSIIGIYLLTSKLFNWKIASIVALLITISPWHLQYSRAAFEATMLLTFIIFATYFFTLGLKKGYFFILSAVCFGLTPYIYSTAVVFTPLWILFLTITSLTFSKDEFLPKRNYLAIAIITLFIAAIPVLYSTYTGVAKERFTLISIFQESVLLDKINVARKGQEYFNLDGEFQRVDPTSEIAFHNKPLIFTQVFFLNYFHSLSFDYLFSTGDPNFRQSIYEMGELYGVEAITILLGIWFLLTKFNLQQKLLVSGWLLLGPIPAALTEGGGHHATRLILVLPPLMILSGLGFYYLFERFKKLKVLPILIVAVLILEFFFYLHRYYTHYPIESWRFWHIGFKEALTYVKEREDNYETIVINDTYEPGLIRYLFFTKFDPAKFHLEFTGDQTVANILPGIDGFKLGQKLYFGKLSQDSKLGGGITSVIKPGMLYMVSARDDVDYDLRDNPPKNINVLKTFFDPLGQPIFYVVEGKR